MSPFVVYMGLIVVLEGRLGLTLSSMAKMYKCSDVYYTTIKLDGP